MELGSEVFVTAAVTLGVALLSFHGGRVLRASEAKKNAADAGSHVVEAATKLVGSLRQELDANTRAIDCLERDVVRLRRLNEWYRHYNAMLVAQLAGLGVAPIAPPVLADDDPAGAD